MNVQELLNYLEKIEDKKQDIFISNDEFDINRKLQIAIEIKSTTEPQTYKNGLYLIF